MIADEAFPYCQADYEAVPCNLCGSWESQTVEERDRNGLRVTSVICRQCGLMYLSPRMTPKWYGRYYEVEYRRQMAEYKRQRAGRRAAPGIEKPADFDKMFARQLRRGTWLAQFLRAHGVPAPRRIMDVGSSTGGVLRALADEFRAEVLGVEPSPDEAAYATSKRVPTDVGLFEDFVTAGRGRFDLVLCTQSFNHLLNPRGVAHKIRDALEPQGTFFLECQDFFHVCQQRSAVWEAVQIDHVFMFVPATLQSMLEVAGFEVLPDTLLCDRFQPRAALEEQKSHGVPSLHVRMLARPGNDGRPSSSFEDVDAELRSLKHAPWAAKVPTVWQRLLGRARRSRQQLSRTMARVASSGRPQT